MSGECTVFTWPAYSSWSSIGIKTRSPSTRESLSSTHWTGAEHNDTRNKRAYHYLQCGPHLEGAVDGDCVHWPGVEDLSDTLLLCCGRSSSSLKLLSWLGSKSSSAAMLSISRLTAPLEGCKITHEGFEFTATGEGGGGGGQLHEIEDHDEDKTISKLRTVDLGPAWHTVNELSKVTRHHITVLMLLNTQVSPPFPHHKELCTHTLSALLVSKTSSSFGLVADGEQCNTLAQIAPYKWFTFFPPLSL